MVKGHGFRIFDARIGHRQRIEVDFFDGNGELHCFAVQRFLNTTDEALIQDVERQLTLSRKRACFQERTLYAYSPPSLASLIRNKVFVRNSVKEIWGSLAKNRHN
ncbi:MAG: hypothetical protein DMG89_17785 [Acidobacteria bacterium]|nr:MAG: hypothetical protein DMG89_17785 [Acidobacteriota bacterium]